jgi:hypothetical protein
MTRGEGGDVFLIGSTPRDRALPQIFPAAGFRSNQFFRECLSGGGVQRPGRPAMRLLAERRVTSRRWRLAVARQVMAIRASALLFRRYKATGAIRFLST